MAADAGRTDILQTTPPAVVAVEPGELDLLDALVVGVTPEDDGVKITSSVLDDSVVEQLVSQCKALGVKAKAEEVTRIPAPSGVSAEVIILVGLGQPETTDQGTPGIVGTEVLRRAAGAALRSKGSAKNIAVDFGVSQRDEVVAVAEGAGMGAYAFAGYKSHDGPEEQADTGLSLQIVASSPDANDAINAASATLEAVFMVRDLVNTPASVLYPETFADLATEVSSASGLETQVWDVDQLRDAGFGGLIGVGQGSQHGPRLVKISYSPADADAHVALVGKGITFDTGGISLKPPASMMTMKSDMTGAATVLAVINAVATLKLPVKITAWMALAENMPSSTAIKPSDVITIYGGKTVEVLNTDAEGRLVLADALQAAIEDQPDAVVDIATLTGAQMVALGNRTTGLMGHEKVRTQLVEAAHTTGETVWPMPIPEELRPTLDSRVADIKNIGDRWGGMLSAAAFLRDFVGDTPWAHLDIAGPSFNEGGAWGYTNKDATGVMVRTLVQFVKQFRGN